jgi:hypothetical protein
MVVTMAVTATLLYGQGRPWWCACGQFFLWSGDVQSSHNSQHLFDPYSFTHVLHGVVICGILAALAPRLAPLWGLWLTVFLESLWELIENSAVVIERYRTATVSLGYQGDTIANSLGDILCGGIGFALARRLGWRGSVVFFLLTELTLLVWIRDDLLLNVLMLICPLKVIRDWQAGF